MHQDWGETIFYKATAAPKKKSGARHKKLNLNSNSNSNSNSASQSHKKLEKERDDFKHKKLDLNFRKQMQQARSKKGYTQKKLAMLSNVPHTLITGYESGKAIPNGRILNRIKRLLDM